MMMAAPEATTEAATKEAATTGGAAPEASTGMELTDSQRRGLLDILTHYETYNEVASLKRPEVATKLGYPFSTTVAVDAASTRFNDAETALDKTSAGVKGTASSSSSWLSMIGGGVAKVDRELKQAKADQGSSLRKQVEGAEENKDSDKDRGKEKRSDNDKDKRNDKEKDKEEEKNKKNDNDKDEEKDKDTSAVPILQMLLRVFPLGLPGLRDLQREFWSERVQGLLARLGEADLSESYDKGALGMRKTLGTGVSALMEMVARGVLGGVRRVGERGYDGARAATGEKGEKGENEDRASAATGEKQYDETKAEDVRQAWDDAVQEAVYGDLIDELFELMRHTEDVEGHSAMAKLAVEYALVHVASFAHRVLIESDSGPYMVRLVENVQGLMPYRLVWQTLRIGNAATMVNGLVRLLLAKLSVGTLTNWVGLTQGADDGMNLMQRIVSLVLAWDAGEFGKRAERAEKELVASGRQEGPDGGKKQETQAKQGQKGLGPKEADAVLRCIRQHVAAGREEHERMRRHSADEGVSMIIALLQEPEGGKEGGKEENKEKGAEQRRMIADMSDEQHRLCLEYYAAQLAVHDRQAISAALCRQTPDLLTRAVREGVAAYEPMIRSVHARVDVKEHLDAVQAFVDDFVQTSKKILEGRATGDKTKEGNKSTESKAKDGKTKDDDKTAKSKTTSTDGKATDDNKSTENKTTTIAESKATTIDGNKSTATTTTPGIEAYVGLLRRHKPRLYRWLHALAAACPETWTPLHTWTKHAATRFQHKRDLATTLDSLVSGIRSPAQRREVMAAVDAHAAYLTRLEAESQRRVLSLANGGPGAYIARWQHLMDETAVTPGEKWGRVRDGADIEGGAGVEGEADGGAPPDVQCVLDALGDEFRRGVLMQWRARIGFEEEENTLS